MLVAAVPPRRGAAGGPTQLYATHLAILLREAAPHLDAEFTARALLAMLRPAQHLYARRALGWPLERLRAGWHALVDATLRARLAADGRRRKPITSAPRRRRRPADARGPARTIASPPGPEQVLDVGDREAQRPADHAQERVLVGADAQRPAAPAAGADGLEVERRAVADAGVGRAAGWTGR